MEASGKPSKHIIVTKQLIKKCYKLDWGIKCQKRWKTVRDRYVREVENGCIDYFD